MNPARYIRKHVLGLSQAELAAALGMDQSSVSTWEANGVIPHHRQLAIRRLAAERNIKWNDTWFFEIPES